MAAVVTKVLLAEPRGFCAGVEMSIKALAWMVRAFPPPVFCYHEIVHNQVVVDEFKALGVHFVDDIEDVPAGAPLMLSAHGTAPDVVERARERTGVLVDAACPLVTKVHKEVRQRRDSGFSIVYLGEAGHDEAVGTIGVAPTAISVVGGPSEVEQLLDPGRPVALLAQTTLPMDEWSSTRDALRERFGEVWTPRKDDLCFATTNRQAGVRALARASDVVIVVGSENSSNTRSLVEIAKAAGTAAVHRVNSPAELPEGLSGVVGVTAGASAPETTVQAVIDEFAPTDGVEVLRVVDEQEYMAPPRDLRRLQQLRPSLHPYDFDGDRENSAAAALDELRNRA